MRAVRVYSRLGCHLCECLIEELVPLLAARGELEVRDVDTNGDWLERFGKRVPVVTIDDHIVCEVRLDRPAVERALSAG